MSFNPSGTQWSVAAFDNNGALGGFHPTPWEFHRTAMHAGRFWVGGYAPVAGSDDRYACEILGEGASAVSDGFEVVFVTADRFIATKDGALYRFGKRL
jgi:hypothetical protein